MYSKFTNFTYICRNKLEQMKRFILCIAALGLCLSVKAQTVRPEWEVHFQAALINDEFDISKETLYPSGTLAALRFTPYGGITFGRSHRIKVGVDVMKDFGTPGTKPVVEPAAWYQFDNDNGFTFAAGIIPYGLLQGTYSSAIFSDASNFYDAHLDGFYLGWKKGKSVFEVALDWNGKYGEVRREQFCVVSYGAGWVTPWLALCWEGMFHHYASSDAVKGVVDDHILHPYVQFELSPVLPLDRMEFSLGFMAGYQMDRLAGDRRIPLGGDLVVDVRKWNFGIRNQFYYGQNQMPFFNSKDAAGNVYGTDLYMRSGWWQIRKDGNAGLYDRVDAYWEKSLNRFVSIGVHAVFHFDYLGLLGSQQIIQARVNLDNIKFRKQ